MFQQVIDLQAESDALIDILSNLDDTDFEKTTQFKDWTFNDIVQHLHFWNIGANKALTDEEGFVAMMQKLMAAMQTGRLRDFEAESLDDLRGTRLLDAYRDFCDVMCKDFGEVDPSTRVKWAGPDMSVRSSVTARQMETWAHGLAIFDRLGIHREDTDRIRNIAVLGVNTFGWTYKNRKMHAPEPPPAVRLTAPSSEMWEWNMPGDGNLVEGSATEFCQVVTQTRNVGDTSLVVKGDVATQWMSMAQCYAGPAEDPPPPGTRYTRS